MKILAFDSTAATASAALTDDTKLLALCNTDSGLTHSELLLPMAESLLKYAKLGFDDIGAYAASVGPGSFTGVRIGAALVKGLAFGKGVPCIGVSALEALAENLAGLNGIAVPVMDARRQQVYTALFRLRDGQTERITADDVMPITELGRLLGEYGSEKIYLVGDGYATAKTGLEKCGIATEQTPPLLLMQNAYSVARVASRAIARGEVTDDTELSPVYLRMPQAERERLERLAAERREK